ncbi:MAG TPA: hypothetical protein VNO52_14870, partial [Methylomirabilota bacterium]|nr:hypothetical protein [Methylomirabilota bacterium]
AVVLRSGKPPGNDEQTQRALERDTLYRLFLIQKMKELDIQPSAKAVGRYTQEQIGDVPYERLVNEFLAPLRLTAEDFERYMRHQAGLQQLALAAGISSKFVSPQDAEVIYRREHRQAKVDVAVFWNSNFLDQVVITNGAIGNFFTNRMVMYRIPDRVEVAYVEFPVAQYMAAAEQELAQVTNLTAKIDEFFLQQGGTNAFKGTNGLPLTEAAAKQKIKDDELRRLALVGARRAATAFGSALMSQPQPHTPKTFEDLAATNGFTVKVTPPFDRSQGLEGLAFPGEFRTRALALSDTNQIAYLPVVGSNAVYVIARKRRIPSEMPAFETVKEKVTTDYKNSQARELAMKAASNFHTNLTNGLATGKTFDELVTRHKVTVISLPPFSAASDPLTNIDSRINFNFVQRFAQDLDPGKASPLLPSADGSMIVYLRERLPVDEEKVKKELPNFVNALRRYRQDEVFQRWFSKNAELARLTPPRRESDKSPAPEATGQP